MPRPIDKPNDWESVIKVAWCIVLGQSKQIAADTGGVSLSTVKNWMASDWWKEAYDEARSMVPAELERKAIGAIISGLDAGDQATARHVADRVVPELAPPAQRVDSRVDAKVATEVVFVGADGARADKVRVETTDADLDTGHGIDPIDDWF